MDRFRHKIRMFLDHRTAWMTIMALALALRLLVLWQLSETPFESDSLYYYNVAESIADDEAFSTYWPPGLILYEAAVIRIFGPSELMVRISMLLWFLLFCRLLYNLLNRMHSRVAANIALIAVAFYPAFVYQSVEPLTQLPTATLLLALFFGMYRYLGGGRQWVWYLGIGLGMVILMRPATGLYFLLVPTLIFFQAKKIIAPTIVAAISIGIVSLWIWKASDNAGRFVPVNEANARNFYLGNNHWTPLYKTWMYGSHWTYWEGHPLGFRQELGRIEGLPPGERSSAFLQAAGEEVAERPHIFALRSLNRFRVFYSFDTFTGSQVLAKGGSPVAGYLVLGLDALVFILIGLAWLAHFFGMGKNEVEGRYMRLSYAWIIVYTLPYLVSFSHPSYHLPVMPFLLLPGAILLAKALLDPTFRWRSGWKWKVAASVFLLMQLEWVIRMLNLPGS